MLPDRIDSCDSDDEAGGGEGGLFSPPERQRTSMLVAYNLRRARPLRKPNWKTALGPGEQVLLMVGGGSRMAGGGVAITLILAPEQSQGHAASWQTCGSRTRLVCRRFDDGTIIWQHDAGAISLAKLELRGDLLLCYEAGQCVHAYGAVDGQKRWSILNTGRPVGTHGQLVGSERRSFVSNVSSWTASPGPPGAVKRP